MSDELRDPQRPPSNDPEQPAYVYVYDEHVWDPAEYRVIVRVSQREGEMPADDECDKLLDTIRRVTERWFENRGDIPEGVRLVSRAECEEEHEQCELPHYDGEYNIEPWLKINDVIERPQEDTDAE